MPANSPPSHQCAAACPAACHAEQLPSQTCQSGRSMAPTTCACTHTNTHARTRTYSRTRARIHTHKHIRVHVRAHTPARLPAQRRAAPRHAHARTHARAYPRYAQVILPVSMSDQSVAALRTVERTAYAAEPKYSRIAEANGQACSPHALHTLRTPRTSHTLVQDYAWAAAGVSTMTGHASWVPARLHARPPARTHTRTCERAHPHTHAPTHLRTRTDGGVLPGWPQGDGTAPIVHVATAAHPAGRGSVGHGAAG